MPITLTMTIRVPTTEKIIPNCPCNEMFPASFNSELLFPEPDEEFKRVAEEFIRPAEEFIRLAEEFIRIREEFIKLVEESMRLSEE